MDPFMGFSFVPKNDFKKSSYLNSVINQFYESDSCELPDLFKKYGQNLFGDCDDDETPADLQQEEEADYNTATTTTSTDLFPNFLQEREQSRLDFGMEDTTQQAAQLRSRSGVLTRAANRYTEPSPFLTPVPTPSPYYSNVSSPESSRKKSGRPEKDISKAEKLFARRQRYMTKSQRKKESNNISCLKHRRRKSKKLCDLQAEEMRLLERKQRLANRYQKCQDNIVTLKLWILDLLPAIEDRTAFLVNLSNFNEM